MTCPSYVSSVSLAGMAGLQITDHFGSLLKLQDLSIKYCKIRTLPPRSFVGLSSLRHLTIETFNSAGTFSPSCPTPWPVSQASSTWTPASTLSA